MGQPKATDHGVGRTWSTPGRLHTLGSGGVVGGSGPGRRRVLRMGGRLPPGGAIARDAVGPPIAAAACCRPNSERRPWALTRNRTEQRTTEHAKPLRAAGLWPRAPCGCNFATLGTAFALCAYVAASALILLNARSANLITYISHSQRTRTTDRQRNVTPAATACEDGQLAPHAARSAAAPAGGLSLRRAFCQNSDSAAFCCRRGGGRPRRVPAAAPAPAAPTAATATSGAAPPPPQQPPAPPNLRPFRHRWPDGRRPRWIALPQPDRRPGASQRERGRGAAPALDLLRHGRRRRGLLGAGPGGRRAALQAADARGGGPPAPPPESRPPPIAAGHAARPSVAAAAAAGGAAAGAGAGVGVRGGGGRVGGGGGGVCRDQGTHRLGSSWGGVFEFGTMWGFGRGAGGGGGTRRACVRVGGRGAGGLCPLPAAGQCAATTPTSTSTSNHAHIHNKYRSPTWRGRAGTSSSTCRRPSGQGSAPWGRRPRWGGCPRTRT